MHRAITVTGARPSIKNFVFRKDFFELRDDRVLVLYVVNNDSAACYILHFREARSLSHELRTPLNAMLGWALTFLVVAVITGVVYRAYRQPRT